MSPTRHEWTVLPQSAGKRLDVLVGEVLSLSRARLKTLFEADAIRVNGRRAKKGQLVEAGQAIRVDLEELPREAQAQPALALRLLAEDEAYLFVDKPSGLPSHPLRAGEVGTVANALVARFPECAQAGEDPREGGLCHRLDVETSGVLMAARHRQAWTAARRAFSEHQVDKRYWALVTGPIADDGAIDLPLRHHPRHPDRVEPAAQGGPGTRDALSSFEVLGRAGPYSLVEVRIVTGVLHQVRAHLAAIGAPLVGDALYGGRSEEGLERFFLHARSLALKHPLTGQQLRVESPLPPDLQAVLARHALSTPPSP